MTFGERIKELRLHRKLSQQYVAKRLNISQTALSSYEIGRVEPSFAIIKMFADFYSVSPYALLPFENNSNEAKTYEIADSIARNDKLRHLFEKTQFFTDASLDAVIAVANALSMERNDG